MSRFNVLYNIHNYQYVGCFVVTLTTMLLMFFVINRITLYEELQIIENAPQSLPDIALAYALESTSFLSYLKMLDSQKGLSFPPHCRTIEFFLACKKDAEENADEKEKDVITSDEPTSESL